MTTKDWDAQDLVKSLNDVMQDQAQHIRYVARVHDYLERGITHLPLFRLGLTGSYASGKSTVAHMFEELGYPIVSADTIVHDLLAHDTHVQEQIRRYFGDGVFTESQINRSALAQRIFTNETDRKKLEAIIHPPVTTAIHQQAQLLERNGHSIACFEIPLLFESGWDGWCDSVIVVAASEADQIARAQAQYGISAEAAQARIHAQLPLEEKKKRADTVIDNTGPLDELKQKVEQIFAAYASTSPS